MRLYLVKDLIRYAYTLARQPLLQTGESDEGKWTKASVFFHVANPHVLWWWQQQRGKQQKGCPVCKGVFLKGEEVYTPSWIHKVTVHWNRTLDLLQSLWTLDNIPGESFPVGICRETWNQSSDNLRSSNMQVKHSSRTYLMEWKEDLVTAPFWRAIKAGQQVASISNPAAS